MNGEMKAILQLRKMQYHVNTLKLMKHLKRYN